MSTPLQQELSSKVEKLTKQVETQDLELAVRQIALEEARRQKDATRERMMQVRQTIRHAKTKFMKLIQQKEEVQKQLQLREKELKLLHTGHRKESEELRSIIQNKRDEIQELQHNLQSVESKLTSERKVTQDLKEKLHQANAALAEKSALAQEREKVNEAFKILLEGERQRVDQLVRQLTSASTSRDQYTREIEVKGYLYSSDLFT